MISSLDDLPVFEAADVAPTIFARKPWTPASACLVLAEEAVDGSPVDHGRDRRADPARRGHAAALRDSPVPQMRHSGQIEAPHGGRTGR